MDQQNPYHFLFKFIIVGDANVGKSCILLQYTEKQFREEHDTTIGVEFGSQVLKIDEKVLKIQIWDTAGQESFKSITRSYYKGSIGVLLVFDVTKRESFHNVLKWYNEIYDQAATNCQIVLVGNKIDLETERQVQQQEAKQFADQYKMLYIETSAKSNQNIDQLFEFTALEIMKKIAEQQIDVTSEASGVKIGSFATKQPEKEKDGCC